MLAVISAALFSRYLDLQRFPHASTPWLRLGGKDAAVSMDQKVSMSTPNPFSWIYFPGKTFLLIQSSATAPCLPLSPNIVAAACIALPSPCLVGCSKA